MKDPNRLAESEREERSRKQKEASNKGNLLVHSHVISLPLLVHRNPSHGSLPLSHRK